MFVLSSLRNLIALTIASVLVTGCSSKAPRPQPAHQALPASVNVSKLAGKAFEYLKANTALDEDSRTNAHIICIADALVRSRGGDWELAVFRKDSLASYALPGGKIGVHSSLMRSLRNQHQSASVIAHALAHMLAHHPEKRVAAALQAHPELDLAGALTHSRGANSDVALGLLGVPTDGGAATPYEAAQEAEADQLALELMARAGFNPREASTAWRSLEGNSRARAFLTLHAAPGSERSARLDAGMATAIALEAQHLASHKKPDCDRIR